MSIKRVVIKQEYLSALNQPRRRRELIEHFPLLLPTTYTLRKHMMLNKPDGPLTRISVLRVFAEYINRNGIITRNGGHLASFDLIEEHKEPLVMSELTKKLETLVRHDGRSFSAYPLGTRAKTIGVEKFADSQAKTSEVETNEIQPQA